MLITEVLSIQSRSSSAPATARWPYLYGVELELENVNAVGFQEAVEEQRAAHGGDWYDDGELWNDMIRPDGWDIHDDGSLRNGTEFVTAYPCGHTELATCISNFYSQKLTYTSTARCSTHIHLNMSDATVDQVRSLIAIVYAIEDGIYSVVDQSRKWAGYSVSLQEMQPSRLRDVFNSPNPIVLRNALAPTRNAERYYGLNFNMSRHGTVEFRYFPGGPSQTELESWIDLVTHVRTASTKYSIADLSAIDSANDMREFIVSNFGEWANILFSAFPAEHYYNKLSEVLALAFDDSNPEITSSVIMYSEGLDKFIRTSILKDNKEACNYIGICVKPGDRTTASDLSYYVTRAQNVAAMYPSDTPTFTAQAGQMQDGVVIRNEVAQVNPFQDYWTTISAPSRRVPPMPAPSGDTFRIARSGTTFTELFEDDIEEF